MMQLHICALSFDRARELRASQRCARSSPTAVRVAAADVCWTDDTPLVAVLARLSLAAHCRTRRSDSTRVRHTTTTAHMRSVDDAKL